MQENDTNMEAGPAKTANRDPFRRYRIAVPVDDKEVVDWINAQSNLSFSIRTVIKAAIKDGGVRDVTCGIQETRVLLGLTRIAEAYQVGIGAVPPGGMTDTHSQKDPPQTPPKTPDQPPMQVNSPAPAVQTPTAPVPPPAQQNTAKSYPAPTGSGQQKFEDPENLLNNM